MWKVEKIENLTSFEVLEIMKVRIDVFVVEQERIYHEVDDTDLIAYHVFHKNEFGLIDAYARIFEKGEHIVFGRVATIESARGTGLGHVLVDKIMEFIQSTFTDRVVEIEAQEYVQPFYEKHGFVAEGNVFIHEGTPHIKMYFKS